jgi:hypothetical protein
MMKEVRVTYEREKRQNEGGDSEGAA